MAKTSANLPSYGEPPLDEIAIAVQFQEIETLRTVDYGALFGVFRDRLPSYEEHVRVQAKFETFPMALAPSGIQFSFAAQDKPALPRAWFVSADGHDLVQIQPDRLIRNWRKVDGEGVYPRFENLLPDFADAYQACEKFFRESGHGGILPNQCEVSYFNNLFLLERQSYAEAFAWFFNPAIRLSIPNVESLLNAEAAKFSIICTINSQSSPVGRLYVEAVPGAIDERAIIRLQLVARGRPETETFDSVQTFAHLCHEAIVKAFDEIISEEAQALWRIVK